ncbi:MAG: tetratricopeptide repeat protein [Bauldia sp.]|nr:MAG: tetratricopeptide repeat protein [Bauldia sp.]
MTIQSFARIFLAGTIATWIGAYAYADTAGGFDGAGVSLSGSYLAARSAQTAQDLESAAAYFNVALAHDPGNPILIERALVLEVANGDIEAALPLADRLVALDPRNPVARLVRAVRDIKDGAFETAQAELAQSAQAPLSILTGGLLGAWAGQGLGKVDAALAAIDKLAGPSWYGIFKDYHSALVADLAGREDLAVKKISTAFDTDGTALRVVEAYGRIMAHWGRRDEAIAGLATFLAEQPNQPIIQDLLVALKSGITPEPIAADARAGAADVLYGIGSAIGTDQGTELPAAYLQLALYLTPESDLTLMALGDLLLVSEHCADAIDIYGRISQASRLRRNADIQSGICLDVLDRTDEAATLIKRVIDASPSDLEAVVALGNIYRGRDRFAEAAEIYSRGIATIATPTQADWRIFYFRGVALERSKQWKEAEADLKKALELNPNQPQVLNYLGYSWVDFGQDLDEGLKMIKAAVDQRPNDGYIVDSLGWAYYRLGRYQEAVEQLERAVELKPEDPVINDHLGDAYWKVDRKLEATFQWNHARDLNPEPADLAKIVKKLESGMSGDVGNDG